MTEYDYQIQVDDIDWSAVAIAISDKHNLGAILDNVSGRSHGNVVMRAFGLLRLPKPLPDNPGRLEVRADKASREFEAKLVSIADGQSLTIETGDLDDLSLFSVERYLRSALRHGVDSEPDHEVGDLQDWMRSMWELLTPAQKLQFATNERVLDTLAAAEGEDIEDLKQETFR